MFVPTTWEKFNAIEQINDLFDDSPLEDRLWKTLKISEIQAERQWCVMVEQHYYHLDFALFCNEGRLNVETNGDQWHAQKEQIRKIMSEIII